MTDAVWKDALEAAALLAVDPLGLGGAVVRAPSGPVRDHWLRAFRAALPPATPQRRVPAHITEDRLLGGLDLAATLRSGRVVAERGLLAEADGGVIVVPMAERLSPATTAHLCAALDQGELRLERDGIARRFSARFGVIGLDEGIGPEERAPEPLADRVALLLHLESVSPRTLNGDLPAEPTRVASARARLSAVEIDDETTRALCGVALTLGVGSLRASYFAVRVARVAAAWAGRHAVTSEDAELAARLVLAPRATRVPAPPDEQPEPEPPPPEPPPPQDEEQGSDQDEPMDDRPLDDILLAAAQAALPPGLLAALALGPRRRVPGAGGPSGELQTSSQRGRPTGVRRGDPRRGRLNLVETLRASAPWQNVRPKPGGDPHRVAVRTEDFRITRYKRRTETTTIFSVDASGSAALQRLAEAKGAVEQLLADCYVRRDHVALVTFRGSEASLLLPPTRSLVRAKRSLAGLPGGGTTPLAAGIDAAAALAEDARRRGQTPVLVVMTDGRANVARDGTPGRARAREDAVASARAVRAAGYPSLFIDTAPRSQADARELAQEMNARYLHLPYSDATQISDVVQSVATAG